jgi:hypothetical protein
MRFYLGTDDVYWLWADPPPQPLFISRRRLDRYRNYKPAQTPWALDSGGFTELNMYGEWRLPPHRYVAKIQRYINEVGKLEWAAPQDWMCEPSVLAKTGKTVEQHQQLTIDNYLTLKTLAPQLPIIPALQGWEPDDYLRHRDMYDQAGIDLTKCDRVGMGTFCRRASLQPVHNLVHKLHQDGIRMHGFGVKQDGLPIMGPDLTSADSLAWSLAARLAPNRLCGNNHKAQKCTHCRTWATTWANKVVASIGTKPMQLQMSYA